MSRPTPEPVADRSAQLGAALAAVRRRITAACRAAGRDPAEVALLPVSKTFPALDVALLLDRGLTEFGENRDAEAAGKVAEVADLRPNVPVRWHMVGRLQRNKARSVARWAAVVQSVDSTRLVDALAAAVRTAVDRGERAGALDVFVQASIDGDPARGGCPLPDLPALAARVAARDDLRLRGVMAVAPRDLPPRPAFERLAAAAERVRAEYPGAVELSAGMSGDLETAIACGSTSVRVGTALFGGRQLASP